MRGRGGRGFDIGVAACVNPKRLERGEKSMLHLHRGYIIRLC